MQKPQTTPNIRDRHQGFKAYGATEAIPTYDNCPNDINPYDNPICAKFAVEPYLLLHNNRSPPSPLGEAPQPVLECLELRPPYYLWVFCNILLNAKMKPRQGSQPDIITTDRIRRILKYRSKSKKVHNVINEAIYWGALTREWTGSYRINWERCAYVASLPPMNPGDRPLNNRSQHYDKRQWGEFRQGLEVIQEFWAFARATRVQATAQAPTGLPDQLSPPQIPPFVPPPNGRLHYTLLELAGHLVWALVLGHGNIYLVPIGVRGGAQSCFPCVSYGGKHLCFGSLRALFTFAGSLEPFPYGGHSTRLVVDAGRRAGLVPFDSFVPATDRYEPGLSQEDSALQYSCLARWNIAITSGPMSPFKGWPALVMVAREGVSKAVSYRPDVIRRDVLVCIDALRGYIHSAVKGLKGNALSPQSSVPYAIALAKTVTVQAQDPPIDIYVEVLDGFKVREGKNTYRHEGARRLYRLEGFAKLLRAKDRPTRAMTVRVIVPLADSPYLKEAFDFGFYYFYHNPLKDQPNAVRAEFRAYEGVTEALGKEGVMKLALGTLHLLEPSLASTYQALATG
jgi:hypothetical protein